MIEFTTMVRIPQETTRLIYKRGQSFTFMRGMDGWVISKYGMIETASVETYTLNGANVDLSFKGNLHSHN